MSTTSGLRGPRDGQLTHIFDAFQYLTGEPGDHLASGLSIVLRALQVIEVRSIAGGGLFFSIVLPTAAALEYRDS